MKIKKCLLIFLSFLLIISFTACKKKEKEPIESIETVDNADVNVDQNVKNFEDEKNDKDKEKKKDKNLPKEKDTETSNLGKRSNPVPFGQWVEFKDTYYESYDSDNELEVQLRVRIIDIVRGDEAMEQLE